MKKRIKKLTTNDLILILSDDPLERFELSSETIKKIAPEYVTEIKVKNKTAFRIKKESRRSYYQDRLNKNFLDKIDTNNSAVAYKKNKSYLDLFEPHRNSYFFLRLDIKSFFHNISVDLLRETFKPYFNDEYFFDKKQKLIDAFINLVTLEVSSDSNDSNIKGKQILPIGFKNSPVISNIVFRKLDILIQDFCYRSNVTYTRYADDMLFSAPKNITFINSDRFNDEISYLLSTSGFKINSKKTIKKTHTLSLNGYVIENNGVIGNSSKIRISNKKTVIISKLIDKLKNKEDKGVILKKLFNISINDNKLRYDKNKNGFKEVYLKSQMLNILTGYRAYLVSIIKYNNKHDCIDEKYINKYALLINDIDKFIPKFT